MSKLTVSKREYEEALQTVETITKMCTHPSSWHWLTATIDEDSEYWPELRDEYTVAQQRISYYVANHAHGLSNSQKKYLVTFTFDPKKDNTKEQFKAGVLKQLSRAWDHVQYAFEHEDSNIHCHSVITTTHRITAKNFDSHQRKYGHVDVRLVKIDNGLAEYISKESPVIEIKK